MRFRSLLLTALLVPLVAVTAQAPSSADDWSGVDAFWRIHDVLRGDREPTGAQWDSLFATPGYALLDARERRRGALQRAFRLAYRPSLRDSLAAERTRTTWVAGVLPHLLEVSESRAALDAFRAKATAGGLLDSARTLAQQWLPAGTTDRLSSPEISWAVFIDARGYPRIVLDPLYVMLHGTPAALLGHEFHHNYRNRLAAAPAKPYGNDMLAWALVNVEVEGLAGLVDKRPLAGLDSARVLRRHPRGSSGSEYFLGYPAVYAASPRWMRYSDSMLVVIASTPDSGGRNRTSRTLHATLPDNGRAMGTWMSEAIIAESGRPALIDVVGDPFGFWLAYQRAALKNPRKYPALDPASVQVIREVQLRYRPPPG